VLLPHRPGTDYIEAVLGRLGREQVLVLIGDQGRVAVATSEVATPEFLSFWH